MLKDLQTLIKGVEKYHIDPWRAVSKKDFTKSLEQITTHDKKKFPFQLQEAVALIGDVHTRVPYVTDSDDSGLPFKLKSIDGKFYIIGTNEGSKNLMFHYLKSINNTPIEDIAKKLSKLSSKENKTSHLSDIEVFLTSLEALQFYEVVDDQIHIKTDKGEFTIKDFEGDIIEAEPLIWKEQDYINNQTFKGYWDYRYRIDKNVLLFQHNDCDNIGHTEKELKEFQRNLLDDAKDVKYIVADLRMNRGGITDYMWDLYATLPQEKEMFVAMSSMTRSAAMHHLIYMYRAYGATLLGESAGQKPNRFGDREIIKLPESGLDIYCSFQYFELLPKQDLDTLEPEISIPVTIDHYATNTDPLNSWIKENLQG